MSEQINIMVIPDGPIKVSNAGTVNFCGQSVAVEGDLYLCRCGDSKSAPYCDGTHRSIGFSGANEKPEEAEIRVWEGQTLRTFFNPKACMHVFYCKPLKALRASELEGDTEAAAEIMKVIGTCPSGALSFEIKDGSTAPEASTPGVTIDIIEGAEVRIQADFAINEPLQERQSSDRATLCRCGKSKNKPWCDGRHKGRKNFR